MKTHNLVVDIPEGHCLCPYPKQWLREYERINLRFPFVEDAALLITIEDVLSTLETHGALLEWTTTYSSIKGTVKFIFGLFGNKFYIEPNHTKDKFTTVSVRGENIRLYAELPKRRNSIS